MKSKTHMKLGDICSFQSGGTPSKSHEEYFNGSIPWISTVALNGGTIDQNSAIAWITEKAIEETAAKIVPPGSVMVGTRVGIGKVAVNSVPMSTSQDIISLVGIDNKNWSTAYLCRFIQAKAPFLKSQARGATIKGIKIDVLENLELLELPLEHQRKIAQSLEIIEKIIVTRRTQLAALDELVKARFVEMFGDPVGNPMGWPVRPLARLCAVGSSKRIYQNELSSAGVPFWRISDLVTKMDTGEADSAIFIPENLYEELRQAHLVPVEGDILVTSRGTLGRCYIVQKQDRFYFQDGMISWLHHYAGNLTPCYLKYLFSMPGIGRQIEAAQAGSTVAYLSISMLKNLLIMLPPKELQERFASFVARVERLKAAIQRSLAETQRLFDSQLQEHFG